MGSAFGGGGKGGGSSKTPTFNMPNIQAPQNQPNIWTERLGDYGTQMMELTQTPRNYFVSDFNRFLRPDEGKAYDPRNLPAFAPLYNLSKTGLEDQYGVAKENILANMPRGGAMGRALGNLETGRAKDVGSLQASISAPIIQDLYNKAYDMSWKTAPTLGMGGIGTAGGLLNTSNISDTSAKLQTNQMATQIGMAQLAADMQAAQASRNASSAKGAGAGSMLGKGLGTVLGPAGSAIGGSLGNSVGGMLGGGGKGSGAFSGALATASFL